MKWSVWPESFLLGFCYIQRIIQVNTQKVRNLNGNQGFNFPEAFINISDKKKGKENVISILYIMSYIWLNNWTKK